MSRIVDGAPFTAPTHCRCGASADDARYNGPQSTIVPGDWLLLSTCSSCRTTFVSEGVNDASKCSGCGHLVLGDSDDPKVLCEVGDGPWQILCGPCAEVALPRHQPPKSLLRMAGVDVGMY